MPQPVGIALLGFGVVGQAVADLIQSQRAEIADQTGLDIRFHRVVARDLQRPRAVALPAGILTTDAAATVASPDVQIVVELIGGIEPARTLILEALAAGKDVVTANKALLAERGREIFAVARAAGRCVAFEASVAGGIPLIESVRRGLSANRVDAVYAILNGTCNYILTRMTETRAAFQAALADAQKLGFAEADPTLDVSGADTAHKLAILASIAMRRACDLARIPTRGITDIDRVDLAAAEELGYVCKLLAAARRYDDGLDLSVQPTLVPRAHPLAHVDGPFNAASIYAHPAGHVFFQGRGAGGGPTASAVVSDIIDVAVGNARRTFESLNVLPDMTGAPAYRPAGEAVSRFYLRVNLLDRPGGIGKIASALGARGVSIAAITQHEPPRDERDAVVPVIVTTHPARRSALDAACAAIAAIDGAAAPPVLIPVLDDTTA